MANKKRTKVQARADKAALKKLKEVGLLTGKVNLSKAPTRSQRSLINKFADVVSGNAVVVRPKDPKHYKSVFRVKGDAVVIPKRKGERITVDKKTGTIVSKRKVGKRTVTSRGLKVAKGSQIERPKEPVQYAVPFKVGADKLHWMRWPNYDEMQKFMHRYETKQDNPYLGWTNYVVEEKVGDELDDDELERRLQSQLRRAKRGKSGRKKRR